MPSDMKAIICESGSEKVRIEAANGETNAPPRFEVVAYTGGAMSVSGWDLPVVVDLEGLKYGNSLVANLDHDRTKRVGNVTSKVIADGKLVLGGIASAATESKREVIESAVNGFDWQASIEVNPSVIESVKAKSKVTVNGQSFDGPLYVARQGTLKGFAFVSHGADDNTTVSIAATIADPPKGNVMDQKFKAWVEAMGFDAESLSDEQRAGLQASYDGRQSPPPPKPLHGSDPFQARKIEAKRREEIRQIADRIIDQRGSSYDEIKSIEAMVDHAIETQMGTTEFRCEIYETLLPPAQTTRTPPRGVVVNGRVIEAAICQSGLLPGHEKMFSDQELQAAHSEFKGRLGLKEMILLCARQNGYMNSHSHDVNEEVLRFAFGKERPIHGGPGFSTIDISDILSNNANKFLREGWMAVDLTPLRIAPVRNVRNFQQITTVSLTGDLQYEQVGSTGEIKHGTLGEETYVNQADTYARMLAITRKDIINDDLGALTAVPRRLGRGAALKLNDIFWTKFLNNSAFFTTARKNANEAVADMTIGGLTATEVIFMDQTDPDGKPLGVTPRTLLVPTALKAAAMALVDPQSQLITGASSTLSNVNVFRGRFQVESSPYMSNTSYTGYSAAAWYMLADPNEMPVIEIAALNGRVEPVVETADADFNTLGIQMRGYSDVGVAMQEYRGGVRADGGSS